MPADLLEWLESAYPDTFPAHLHKVAPDQVAAALAFLHGQLDVVRRLRELSDRQTKQSTRPHEEATA